VVKTEESENGQNNEEDQPAPRPIRPDQIVTTRSLTRRKEGQVPEQPHQRNESSLGINPAQMREREHEAEKSEQERMMCAHFIRGKLEYEKKLNQAVKMLQLNTEQIWRVTIGLKDLFKYEINPMTQKMIPEKDDWDGWLAFERGYE
jgi:hypothetical protein